MGYSWLSTALVLVATYGVVKGRHFRGGSMSWQPAGDNQIELKFRASFTAEFNWQQEGDLCTEDAIANREPLNIKGENGRLRVKCETCPPPQDDYRKLDWICDGIDREEDSTWGHYSLLYDVPHPQFEISNQGCCWINLQSPIGPGAVNGWKMLAYIDMTPHPRTGRINSSPIAASVPVEKFYKGCDYNFRIAASDPDNDEIRCRYARQRKGECHDTKTKACGKTDGLTIDPRNCIMRFNTNNIEPGDHAVNVIIEDFARPPPGQPANKKASPLSKVSLLFLMEVGEESATCAKPNIISPQQCMMVRPGEQTTLVVKADPGDPSKPIVNIRAQGPQGMTQSSMESDPESPGRKRKTLQWTPTEDDVGDTIPVSYSALDNAGYTSGAEFTFIHVSNEGPLRVDLENSSPSPGSDAQKGSPWPISVAFNRPIAKPVNPAFIRLVNADTDELIYEVDVSRDWNDVQYGETKMELVFDDPNGMIGTQTRVKLQIGEGVAMPADETGCSSEAAEWEIILGALQPVTREPPVGEPVEPPLECNDKSMTIDIPNSVQPGEKCFLHLPDRVTVTHTGINTPYQLCCESACSEFFGAGLASVVAK